MGAFLKIEFTLLNRDYSPVKDFNPNKYEELEGDFTLSLFKSLLDEKAVMYSHFLTTYDINDYLKEYKNICLVHPYGVTVSWNIDSNSISKFYMYFEVTGYCVDEFGVEDLIQYRIGASELNGWLKEVENQLIGGVGRLIELSTYDNCCVKDIYYPSFEKGTIHLVDEVEE